MENRERQEGVLPEEKDRSIQLVVNQPQRTEDRTIDLGNVIQNMKAKKRIFAWVLVLCLVVGVCAPLLLYQFTKPYLTVSSVVTLRYEAPVKVWGLKANGTQGWMIPEDPEYGPVSDLSAPDGSDLDLNQITSAYVLQTALDGMSLSKPVPVSQLRSNISIQTLLTDASQRTKEALAGLAEVKNADAYNQLRTAEMQYQNKFVVTLTNGFADEEAENPVRTELKDSELKLLLNRILSVYNEYLMRTYANLRLPEDQISIIDIKSLDVQDSLDQLRSGLDSLYSYCDEKSVTVKEYRSWQTGRSLADWMESLQTFRSINVEFLYSMVSANTVTRDRDALATGWKYILRSLNNELGEVNESIAETKRILEKYKNDEIFISMQESEAARTTTSATEYYNDLVLKQMYNYDRVAELKSSIMDYEDRIRRLEGASESGVSEAVEEELARSLASAQSIYEGIRAHMEELFESPMYATYETASTAQGRQQSFLSASMKKMVIGGVLCVMLGFALWFLAGLLPEFSKNRKQAEQGKGAAAV